MSNFGVYEREGSPFWWIWFGAGENRKMESSKKLRTDPLGWKRAYDLAKMKAGAAPAQNTRSSKAALFDVWVDDWLALQFPNPEQQLALGGARRHWRYVRAFLGSHNINEPSGVTYSLAMDYLAWRQKNRRHPDRPKMQSAVIEVKLLNRVMREAVRRGLIERNPLAEMKVRRPKYKEKPEITTEEERVIREHLAKREGHLPVTQRWMTVSFLFGIRHGWRIAETSFPLSRVNFEKWEVLVRSKGDKWRTVPLHPEVRPILAELKQAGAAMSCVFPKNNAGRASYAWSLFLRGNTHDKVVGILPHLCHHCCRVTVISRLARAGVSERIVMEFVGHWSVTSHRIYSRVAHGDLARCIFPDAPASAAPPSPSPGTGASGGATS